MKRFIFFIIPIASAFCMIIASCTKNHQYEYISYAVVTTFASEGPGVYNPSGATTSSFNVPSGVAVDGAGNVYVADTENELIRKISPTGVVSNLAGSGQVGSANGTGMTASFSEPLGVAVDGAGNVYVADAGNNLIREISPTGVVTTLAGNGQQGSTNGMGTAASFNFPSGVAVDGAGNIYVADFGNCLVRKINSLGEVTTLAGNDQVGSTNGTGAAASFNLPMDVALDGAGNVYVTDYGNNLIRKISPSGVVTTLAGSGQKGSFNASGTAASFNNPYWNSCRQCGKYICCG